MHSPELLILDEPMAGLSARTRAELSAVIRERAADGATVVLSSSQLSDIDEVCDRVGILLDGRLISVGNPRELEFGSDAQLNENEVAQAEAPALTLKLA
jgi:ABC-2 type transport system ATP-binding protein